jgi:hypothetical protein
MEQRKKVSEKEYVPLAGLQELFWGLPHLVSRGWLP